MVPLMALGLGLNFANSLFGGFQLLRGLSQAKSNQRPNYDIPKEIGQNLNQAQLYAQQGLPMDVYNRATANIDRNAAFGLRSLGDRRSGIAGISALNQSTNDAYSNLAMQDAQARMNNLAQLYNARSTMAGYRDKAFELNKMQPYMQRAQEAQALQGAGLQNIMRGLQGAGNTLSAQAYNNALNPAMNGGGMANPLEGLLQKQNNTGAGYYQPNDMFMQMPSPMMYQPQQFNPYQAMISNYGGGYNFPTNQPFLPY